MKFIIITALTICVAAKQALASPAGFNVAFNVSPVGVGCGSGTTILCALSPNQTCSGDFTPIQATGVITMALNNCFISFYSKNGQQGVVVQSVSTSNTGNCVLSDPPALQGYQIFC